MGLLSDPQVWLSFLTLAVLEIVLGIDNIIFLAILVDRLPSARRASARILGLSFAMLTRIALLYSITWMATLRATLFTVLGNEISGRDLILFGGGLFLVVKSPMEIRDMLTGKEVSRKPGGLNSFWMIILQIGIIDIVFSLDSVFVAVGLAKDLAIMVAAIIAAIIVMMWVAGAIGDFVERHPTVKMLALAFLILIGATLVAEALHYDMPKKYLYFAMAFAAAVELINLRVRALMQANQNKP